MFMAGMRSYGQDKIAGDNPKSNEEAAWFPSELVNFRPYATNPVFAGTGTDTWDRNIR